MKKLAFLFSLLTLVSLFTRCKDDEGTTSDTYEVSIEVLHPDEGDVLPLNVAADIHVKFTRADNQTIHNVLLQILDNADNVVATLQDEHSHQTGELKVEGSFTPTIAGTYKVKAETTDDDDLYPNTKISTFIVQ